MNNLYGWVPEPYYNLTEVQNHSTMPRDLKAKINKIWSKHCQGKGSSVEAACPRLRMVWVTCDGETAADKEYIGPLHYTPLQGFQGAFFPFLNQEHYLGPLVWVQFRDLMPGVMVNVQCKLWAKNIKHDDNNPRYGGVHFEILME